MSETNEGMDLYLTPSRVGETPEVRASQLKSLLKHPGYKMLIAEIKSLKESALERLVRFNPQDGRDIGFVIALQAEVRIFASLVGGYDLDSLVDLMLKEELENAKQQKGDVDNSDTEQPEETEDTSEDEGGSRSYSTPSPLL